jgi:hypothetical protein
MRLLQLIRTLFGGSATNLPRDSLHYGQFLSPKCSADVKNE